VPTVKVAHQPSAELGELRIAFIVLQRSEDSVAFVLLETNEPVRRPGRLGGSARGGRAVAEWAVVSARGAATSRRADSGATE